SVSLRSIEVCKDWREQIMSTILQRTAKPLVRQLSRPAIQPMFQRIFQVAIMGMNVGHGAGVKSSGEQIMLRHIAREVRSQCIVFDVGGNVGNYSASLLEVFGNRAEIYMFEPSKTAFTEAVSRLHIYPNVKLYNVG